MREILEECVRALEAVAEAVANHQAAGLVRSALGHGKAELARPEEKLGPIVVLAKPEERHEVFQWVEPEPVIEKPIPVKVKKRVHKKR